MSNILITFGGRAYDRHTSRLMEALAEGGVSGDAVDSHILVYDDRWLMAQPFYKQNIGMFTRTPQHGFGFCCWKPFIIQHALSNYAALGDVVMYLDGDCYPINQIGTLFEMAETDDIVLFEEQGCINKTWIKADCFIAMGAEPSAHEAQHACGRCQLFRYGSWRNDQFLQEWLTYSLNPRCMFHEGSGDLLKKFDDETFIRNSCEQSVLSLLAHKYGIPLHRNPDQSGWPIAWDGKYKPGDTYGQLFLQDGARGNTRDLIGSRWRNV
jgi:hypothetical protein